MSMADPAFSSIAQHLAIASGELSMVELFNSTLALSTRTVIFACDMGLTFES